jgi:hypothetical protein
VICDDIRTFKFTLIVQRSYRVLHAAARLARGGRRRRLRIAATWPWAEPIAAAWAMISALPQAP